VREKRRESEWEKKREGRESAREAIVEQYSLMQTNLRLALNGRLKCL
jgi:hypothetical protein